MKRFIFLISIMLVSMGVGAAEGFPDPFGLTWGMSEASLVKLGFARPSSDSGQMHVFTSTIVPKPWSEAETYAAITYNDQLVKVVAVSKSFSGDIAGSEGKAAYEKINRVLQGKYGQPATHMEQTGLKLYKEYDEFYQCLKYAGCGVYFASYDIASGTIGVNLEGESRGAGYLKVTYESPAFSKALDEVKKKVSSSDADAF
jgi:hypothetical protein